MGFFSDVDLTPVLRRLDAIERKLDRLLAERGAGPEAAGAQRSMEAPPSAWEEEVRALVRQGRKIDAIKLYREHTGLGLREAKDAVEALE